MAKWEYRVCAAAVTEGSRIEEDLNSRLKIISEEGWRYLETIYAQNTPLLLFKKPAKLNVRFDKSAAG